MTDEQHIEADTQQDNLKRRTARSMKWNVIDRFGSQILYAVTGVVLARLLSQHDFGLVGAVLVFQAFASLLIDSGLSSALIQRKAPSRLDYSSVLWFNIIASFALYAILFVAAPAISGWFHGGDQLTALARVMFLSLPLNAAAIVQTNLYTKQLNVRPVAIANAVGLCIGAVIGIWLAFAGYGAWAIVWQTITVAATKTLMLWIMSRWRPLYRLSWKALLSFAGVGAGMMLTSLLNTIFLNIYAFLIGNRVGLVSLGYYSQADKWSKMMTASLSQVLTSTFVPVLSGVQDQAERFARLASKMDRVTAYILFPVMVGLAVCATPIFHILFGAKWDASIILFQLLLARGIFTVLTGLYSNYLLALGRARTIFYLEVLRDAVALVAIAITFPYMDLSTTDNIVLGVEILLWGQLAAAIVAWAASLIAVSRATSVPIRRYLADIAPYAAMAVVIGAAMLAVGNALDFSPWLALPAQAVFGASLYFVANRYLGSTVQSEALAYILPRRKSNKLDASESR